MQTPTTVPKSCAHARQHSVSSAGQWMKVQGKFKMQAHIISSGVVMDVAAFKVSHSVDIDATALRAVRVRLSSIGALDDSSKNVRKASRHR